MFQRKATKPLLYVIAYNSEKLLKDVTRRYCPQWLSVTRKQRIDEKWWTETLSYWLEGETAMSKREDELLLQKYISPLSFIHFIFSAIYGGMAVEEK
jgi:xeroderma pigmentosum group C-complementing protein